MYIPSRFRVEDRDEIVNFMRTYSFAVLVSGTTSRQCGGVIASHLPVVTEVEESGEMRVLTHLARANPQVAQLHESTEVLAIFHGPHAYVSPTSYDHQNNVPTWDYVAVHAYGRATLIEDDTGLVRILGRLTAVYDPSYEQQWEVLPAKFKTQMLRQIVGVDISISKVEAQFKLSQNKSQSERQRIASVLQSSSDANSKLLADFILRTIPSTTKGSLSALPLEEL